MFTYCGFPLRTMRLAVMLAHGLLALRGETLAELLTTTPLVPRRR